MKNGVSRSLDAQRITVEVDGGKRRLYGRVLLVLPEKQETERAAWPVPDTSMVENYITIAF